jgi:uncharacterized protein (DUF427 family)
MSLTTGSGPFGSRRKGRLNFEPPERVVYVEPWPRRVRGLVGDEAVVDSERAVLVHESGRLPRYAFPQEDVAVEAAAEPEMEGYVSVPWSAAERWLEEEQEVIVHPRDPYHRIEILPSARQVRVLVHGVVVAETTRPQILFETGMAPRYYLPLEDVRTDLLEPAGLETGCPYKGYASYWDVVTEDGRAPGAAWSYREPLHESERIRGLVCFFQERPEIDVEVDGGPAEAPQTPWSGTEWMERARASA